jgi:hypothetical protein
VSPRSKAILYRFLVGLVIVEIPVLTVTLQQANPDYRVLLVGLLGGLATALDKYFAPQLVTTLDGGAGTLAQAPLLAMPSGAGQPAPLVVPQSPPSQPSDPPVGPVSTQSG